MTLKRTAAALAITVGVLILVGSFGGDGSVTINDREIEGPLKALILGAGTLFALLVGGFVFAGAGVLVVGILVFVGATLLLAFAPFLAPLLVAAFVIYLLGRRGAPATTTRDRSAKGAETENFS